MFEVNNGTANINGAQGKYDEKTVTNPSVRYGRNVVDNYYSFINNMKNKKKYCVLLEFIFFFIYLND